MRNQVIARIREAGIGPVDLLVGRRGAPPVWRRGARRHRHGPPRHLQLVVAASPGELLDGVSIPVPRREVHLGHAGPVAESLVNQADAFEEIGPVGRRQEAHARDDVANRRVVGDLLLVLLAHDLLGRGSVLLESAVEPLERGRDRRVLLAQALDELDGEGLRERRALQHREDRAPLGLGDAGRAEQSVGDPVRSVPRGPPRRDPLREPPEILDEDQSQRDRQRPELADRERLDPLVGPHESPEGLELDPAVGVRDERPGQPVDAGKALERALGELRQLPIEPRRKVLLDLPDLLLDDVEVVQQPVGGRRNRAGPAARVFDRPVRRDEGPRVLAQPGKQTAAPSRGRGGRAAGPPAPPRTVPAARPRTALPESGRQAFAFALRLTTDKKKPSRQPARRRKEKHGPIRPTGAT